MDFWIVRNFGKAFNLAVLLLTVLGVYYALVIILRLVVG